MSFLLCIQEKRDPVLGNAILVLGVKPNANVFWLFFKIDLCSAISFERSRRELSSDVAEHSFMLKNYQNTHYPRFSFVPKTGTAPKQVQHQNGSFYWVMQT